MTNFDKIRQMTVEEFAEWMENFVEAYISFWIMPLDMCDFSHRDRDKKILLEVLKDDYVENRSF